MIEPTNSQSAPLYIKYCPKCGQPLSSQKVGDKPRRVCQNCGYIHFTDPKVGVGVLVIHQDRILLVKRSMAPERGKWSIPAGFLDHGENPIETAEREVLEETNLQVTISQLLDIYHNKNALIQGGASIFILYKASLVAGELAAGDDADEARFFNSSELPELAFESTRDAIRHWKTTYSG